MMKTARVAAPLAAIALLGMAQPAEACWWLFKKQAAEAPAAPPAPVAAPAAPAAPPVVAAPAAPPVAEECAIESKLPAGLNVIKSQRKWVEPVYEMRDQTQYCPPVLETVMVDVPVPEQTQTCFRQVWVEPVFTTACRKVYHPPTFKTVCQPIEVPATFTSRDVQKYVPPVVRCEKKARCIPDGRGGFTSVEDVEFIVDKPGRFETVSEKIVLTEATTTMRTETVQDKPGYYTEHVETMMVSPGYFRTVDEKVVVRPASVMKVPTYREVKPGRIEKVQVKVLAAPGHWEEVGAPPVANPC